MAGKLGTRAEVAQRWRERLARWQRSGFSISEFCRRENLSLPSFFQWRKKLGGDLDSCRPSANVATSAFVPVHIVSPPPHSLWIEIRLGEVLLRVPTSIDEQALRQLLRVAREEAAGC